MRAEPSKPRKAQRGVSMFETLMVLSIIMILSSLASPAIVRAVYNMRLLGAAGDLAGLVQQARIMAAKNNASTNNPGNPNNYTIRYQALGGGQIAFIDLNGNGTWDNSVTINGVTQPEPQVAFSGTVVSAGGPPNGAAGAPPNYVLAGDTSAGAVNTNGNVMGFSSRGLPCNFDAPPTCSTPSTNYFVYYLTDTRMGRPGWAAVCVTKAGRTRVVMWDGGSWR